MMTRKISLLPFYKHGFGFWLFFFKPIIESKNLEHGCMEGLPRLESVTHKTDFISWGYLLPKSAQVQSLSPYFSIVPQNASMGPSHWCPRTSHLEWYFLNHRRMLNPGGIAHIYNYSWCKEDCNFEAMSSERWLSG